MNNFFLRLKEERVKTSLSAGEFALVGGVKQSAQFRYEKGETAPDINYLINLYDKGIDVDYIIKGKRSAESPISRALLDAFFNADEMTQQMIARLLGLDLSSIKLEIETNNEGGQGNVTGNNSVGHGSFTGNNNTNNSNNSSSVIGHIKKVGSIITGSGNTVNLEMGKKNG